MLKCTCKLNCPLFFYSRLFIWPQNWTTIIWTLKSWNILQDFSLKMTRYVFLLAVFRVCLSESLNTWLLVSILITLPAAKSWLLSAGAEHTCLNRKRCLCNISTTDSHRVACFYVSFHETRIYPVVYVAPVNHPAVRSFPAFVDYITMYHFESL